MCLQPIIHTLRPTLSGSVIRSNPLNLLYPLIKWPSTLYWTGEIVDYFMIHHTCMHKGTFTCVPTLMIHVSPAPPSPPSNLLHKESDEAQRQLSKQEGGDGKCER